MIESLGKFAEELAGLPAKERSAFQSSAFHQISAARQNLLWHEEAQAKQKAESGKQEPEAPALVPSVPLVPSPEN